MNILLFFALSAAFAFALGNLFQKVGLHRGKQHSPSGIGSWTKILLRSPIWGIGIVFSTIGALLQYYAMARWDISIVQPLIGMNPVLTAVLGWLVLKERSEKKVWWALLCAVFGVVAMGMSGSASEGVLNPQFGWFAGTVGLMMFVLHRVPWGTGEVRDSVVAGIGFGLSVILYKAVALSLSSDFASEGTIGIGNIVQNPYVWGYFVVYGASFFASQSALAQGRAMVVVPLSSVIGSALPVTAGILLMGEPFDLYKGIGLFCFLFALVLFLPLRQPLQKN